MKRPTIAIAFLALASGLCSAREYRTFTSADGTKKMDAAVVNVFRTKSGPLVEIERKENRQRYKVKPDYFTEEDQAYIKEAGAKIAMGRSLAVRIEDSEERSKPNLTAGRRIVTSQYAYDINLRNNGKAALEGFDVNYTIYYKKALREGKTDSRREMRTVEGSIPITKIHEQTDTTERTEEFELVSDRPNVGGPG